MKTENILLEAAEHFRSNYNGDTETYFLMQRYAMDELEMNQTLAGDFAVTAIDGSQEPATDEEQNRFYFWYYVNIMVPESGKLAEENLNKAEFNNRVLILK